MSLKGVLIALLVMFLVTAGASLAVPAPPLPWATFSEMAQAPGGDRIVACPQGAVFVSVRRWKDVTYILLVGERHDIFVMLYDPAPNRSDVFPTEYAVRTWAGGDMIPPLVWAALPPTPTREFFCGLLYKSTV